MNRDWELAARYWHKECLAARDCIAHLMREFEDHREFGNGFMNVTRGWEIVDGHGIPQSNDSEFDPNNYADPSAVAALTDPEF